MEKYDWLDGWLLGKAGCVKDYKQEWGWWRWSVGGRMFAACCTPGAAHRDYGGQRLLTLKCDPRLSELFRAEYPDIVPGFYMDKRHWISVRLDGALPDEVLRGLCDHSYELVFSKLTKRAQREIESAEEIKRENT